MNIEIREQISSSNYSKKESKRVFFMGIHVVLTQTELPRLRLLGYEVYNPPYLSSVFDQSAVLDWTEPEKCTLPEEARKILSKTNLFYEKIPVDVAEILNEYFDVVIVTGNIDWLDNLLRVYDGPVIYKAYGQPFDLSEELLKRNMFKLILERENFWFCPHSDLLVDGEDPRLLERTRVVPYCITDDVVALENTWKFFVDKNEMGLLCPRILDYAYYTSSFADICKFFPEESYKVFGKQLIEVKDPRVVGNLEREKFLLKLRSLRAFVYHYPDPGICYLPPIEFMTLGGPALFQKGSLLARYLKSDNSPGMAKDMRDLVALAKKVQYGDSNLINEIIDSQRDVVSLYHPKTVWPIFDKTMKELIEGKVKALQSPLVRPTIQTNFSKSRIVGPDVSKSGAILVLFHIFGPFIVKDDHGYHCCEGIPIVIRNAVYALCKKGHRIVVTSRRVDAERILGFFQGEEEDINIQIMFVDKDAHGEKPKVLRKVLSRFRNFPYRGYIKKIKEDPLMKGMFSRGDCDYIHTVNSDSTISGVLIPVYNAFPEAVNLEKPSCLYLPDYFPHFYPNDPAMGSVPLYQMIGKVLSDKAKIVFTPSHYSQRYLPKTALKVDQSKIVYFPLPWLTILSAKELEKADTRAIGQLPRYFIFYPTRNRPSKRLKDFVKTLLLVNEELEKQDRQERVYGVLTTEYLLNGDKDLEGADKYLKCIDPLSDTDLIEAYRRALALLFTSENEGNFPTQVNEALHLGTPVVATNIPLITEELDGLKNELQLVMVGDCQGMAKRVLEIFKNRDSAVEQQSNVRKYIMERFSYETFSNNIDKMMSGLISS